LAACAAKEYFHETPVLVFFLVTKKHQNRCLGKFYSAAEGGRILARLPQKILFGGVSREIKGPGLLTQLHKYYAGT
jgi:hypothetical protein